VYEHGEEAAIHRRVVAVVIVKAETLNLFMKWLTREPVVPTIWARLPWLTLGTTVSLYLPGQNEPGAREFSKSEASVLEARIAAVPTEGVARNWPAVHLAYARRRSEGSAYPASRRLD
jgi:hypothetical protein